MSEALRIVGLGGSLSSPSTSLLALEQGLDGAASASADVRLFDVRELSLPLYDPAVSAPSAAVELCDAVAEADGLLWSSPLYHGTISGSFKNALDWLQLLAHHDPPYLTDKVVGLVSTAGGVQGLQAVNTMEFVVRALRGWAVPLVIAIPQAFRAFDKDGHLLDKGVADQLHTLGSEVVRAARQFHARGLSASSDDCQGAIRASA